MGGLPKERVRLSIAPESMRRARARLREITGRSRGRSLEQVIGELKVYLTGWRNYYSLNELPSLTSNLLSWIRRELLSNVVYGVGQAAFLSDSSSTWTPSLNFTLFTTNVSSTNPLSRFHFFCAASSSL